MLRMFKVVARMLASAALFLSVADARAQLQTQGVTVGSPSTQGGGGVGGPSPLQELPIGKSGLGNVCHSPDGDFRLARPLPVGAPCEDPSPGGLAIGTVVH
jgi:hypothetical protein